MKQRVDATAVESEGLTGAAVVRWLGWSYLTGYGVTVPVLGLVLLM